MKTETCDICGKSFEKLRSHRRWHDLPEYKEYQDTFRKKNSERSKGNKYTLGQTRSDEFKENARVRMLGNKYSLGYKQSDSTKKKRALALIGKTAGDKHPFWKGDSIEYFGLHSRMRKLIKQPDSCSDCGKITKKLDLANISQLYKLDINDWEYICRKCHQIKDGRMIKLKLGLNKKGVNGK